MTMIKFEDYALAVNKGGVTQPLTNAAVAVTRADTGTAASLYLDAAGTQPIASLKTDATGRIIFYSAAGSYIVTVSGNGFATFQKTINVHDEDDDAMMVSDYAALRTYSGQRKSLYVTGYLVSAAPSAIAGIFARDDVDSTTADNGGTVIVAVNGVRWKRVIPYGIDSTWFGHNDAAIQATANAAALLGVGSIRIKRGSTWDPSIHTFQKWVDIFDDSATDSRKIILNGGNSGGAVNEFEIQAGFHPAYITNVYNNRVLSTLGAGQIYSNRASPIIIRVNGNNIWQVANDINATMNNDLTFYRLSPSSLQMLTLHNSGKMIYGQKASGGDWGVPDYAHNFRGANFCFENSSGNISWIFRIADNSKRKIITFDVTNDELYITNTANTEQIFDLTDKGNLMLKRGVSGGAFTTTQRNALTVTSGMIGLMVYDTTLGKPVFLHNATGPVWHDATGATV